jgi:predicted RNA binding protein YcfA (HicA-like mRNA interferase family)
MPPVKSIKRTELVYYLKQCGFNGPYSGGKHQFMLKDRLSITIPNPHQSDIGKEFLKNILKQAKISIEEWEKL